MNEQKTKQTQENHRKEKRRNTIANGTEADYWLENGVRGGNVGACAVAVGGSDSASDGSTAAV